MRRWMKHLAGRNIFITLWKVTMKNIKAVVLAAGKGTRISSAETDAPKVMRMACEKPLLGYVLEAISFIEKKDTIIVVGYKKESIIDYFGEKNYTYVIQEEQLGTGHAVMAAKEELKDYKGNVLLCYGDMPLMRSEAYENLLKTHIEQENDCTILSSENEDTMSFGRIERDENGQFVHIVEDKDCTPRQKKITELNTGIYIFDTELLLSALGELKNNNSQGEYYVTDVPKIMKDKNAKIGIYKSNLADDIIGVNTVEQLNLVEDILRRRKWQKNPN